MHTPIGLFRMTQLPQGWTNSVAISQRIMNKILLPVIPEKVRIFIDDGIIKGPRIKDETYILPGIRKFISEHADDVTQVLKLIENAGLTISAIKSRFAVTSAEVLGYLCTSDGQKLIERTMTKIENWPLPKDKKAVHEFIATCAFYRHWIEKFSIIAKPLYYLQKKAVPFHWKQPQQDVFKRLKCCLAEPPVLINPTYGENTKPLIITVDASPIGAGAVLSQENNNGQ